MRVAHSDTNVAFIRENTDNMLHMAFHITQNHSLHALWWWVSKIANVVAKESGDTITDLKSKDGCAEWTWRMSQPAAADYLCGILDVLSDETFMRQVGIYQADRYSTWSLPENEANLVAEYAFRFASHLIYQEVLYTMRFNACPPGLFGGLLKEATTPSTLAKLKTTFDVLEKLEEASWDSGTLDADLRLLMWPRATWVMEHLIGLAETNFAYVDELQKTELKSWPQAHTMTKQCEDGFNVCRAAGNTKSSAMCAERLSTCFLLGDNFF